MIAQGALVEVLPQVRVTNTTNEEGIVVTDAEAPFTPAKRRIFIDCVVARWGEACAGANPR